MSRLPLPFEHPKAWRNEPAGHLRDSLRLARDVERRAPTEDDCPPPRPFPGRKHKPIPGQLSLFDRDEAA